MRRAALVPLTCLAACGPSAPPSAAPDTGDPPPAPARVEVDVPVGGGFPHVADLLVPRGASSRTRAIVALHGGGGTKEQFAYSLGIKRSELPGYDDGYRASWLDERDLALVFVQGLAIPARPEAFTWNNTIMTSGVDDAAMLAHLADRLREEEAFEEVYLMGHSMGGSMVNRMWCEHPASFDAYGSSAGPMSNDLAATCSPAVFRPYLHVTGLNDRVLQIVEERLVGPPIDHSGEPTLTLENVTRALGGEAFVHEPPEFRNELVSYAARAQQVCGAAAAPPVEDPPGDAWSTRTSSDCDGALGLIALRDRDHCVGGEDAVGTRFCDVPLSPWGTTEHLDRFAAFFDGL